MTDAAGPNAFEGGREPHLVLVLGDALKILPEIGDRTFGTVLTSPPFQDDDVPTEYYSWMEIVLLQLKRVAEVVVMLNSSRRLVEMCKRFDPSAVLIWDKKVGMGAFRYESIYIWTKERIWGPGRIWSDTLAFAPIIGKMQKCKYENPVPLYHQLLRYFKDFSPVLDPFAGSGTTGLAALQLGMDCLLIEKDPQTHKIARTALQLAKEKP